MQAAPQTEAAFADVSEQFDERGRCLPLALSAPVHLKSRYYFQCAQPPLDYAAIHQRSIRFLGPLALSAAEFQRRSEAILQRLAQDSSTAPILNGVTVPFILPQAAAGDIGAALSQQYLPAVAASFCERFPDYRFNDHNQTELAGRLSVLPASRHQQLLEAMAGGDLVGIYFPALTEYSVPAAFERLAALPEDFSLAGGYDTAAALIGSPELLMRYDGYPPLLWLAALGADRADAAYHFEAYGYNLCFNYRPHFNQVAEYWACGLVVTG